MRGKAIFIASSFVFHFVFLWPKSHTSGPCLLGNLYEKWTKLSKTFLEVGQKKIIHDVVGRSKESEDIV